MQSLFENRPLFLSLVMTELFTLMLVTEMNPDLNAYFEMVSFPSDLRQTILVVMVLNFVACLIFEKISYFIFKSSSKSIS